MESEKTFWSVRHDSIALAIAFAMALKAGKEQKPVAWCTPYLGEGGSLDLQKFEVFKGEWARGGTVNLHCEVNCKPIKCVT